MEPHHDENETLKKFYPAVMHLVLALSGIVLAFQALSIAPASAQWRWSGLGTARNWHVILRTGCWSVQSEPYYDFARNRPVAHPLASFPEVLNFAVRNEGGPRARDRFYFAGKDALTFEGHLLSIHQACAIKNVRSILYMNGPGGLVAFDNPADNLAVVPVLESIAREYPGAAPHARTYLARLQDSNGYQQALEREKTLANASTSPRPQNMNPWRAIAAANACAQKLRSFRESAALGLRAHEMNDTESIRLLEACAERRNHPEAEQYPFRRMMRPEDFWTAAGGEEAWTAWMRMVLEMCKARGIDFVFYIPPHVNVTGEEYATGFQPFFTERVRAVCRDYPNAHVIDQARQHDLNAGDMLWFFPWTRAGIRPGYLSDMIGKLKTCRGLLRALAAEGVTHPDSAPQRAIWGPITADTQPGAPLRYIPEEKRRDFQEYSLREEVIVRSMPRQ